MVAVKVAVAACVDVCVTVDEGIISVAVKVAVAEGAISVEVPVDVAEGIRSVEVHVKVGVAVLRGVEHFPPLQYPQEQSVLLLHFLPSPQGMHDTPPQSISVSFPFCTPSLQEYITGVDVKVGVMAAVSAASGVEVSTGGKVGILGLLHESMTERKSAVKTVTVSVIITFFVPMFSPVAFKRAQKTPAYFKTRSLPYQFGSI